MQKEGTISWQAGVSDAPLPPLADPSQPDIAASSRMFVACYQHYGPVFRLPRPGKMLTVLAGPDANAFVARYGDQLFSTEAFWKDFKDAMDMHMERDGDANRQRRARVGRSYSRARVLDQLPRMIEITHEFTQDWQPGAKITALPSMQRIVAEQLGQLLVN